MNNELNNNESEIRYDVTEFPSESVINEQEEVNTANEEFVEEASLNPRQKKVINVLSQLKNLRCLL